MTEVGAFARPGFPKKVSFLEVSHRHSITGWEGEINLATLYAVLGLPTPEQAQPQQPVQPQRRQTQGSPLPSIHQVPPEIVDHKQEEEELAGEVESVLNTWLQEEGGPSSTASSTPTPTSSSLSTRTGL